MENNRKTPLPSVSRLLISHITLRGPELAQVYALIAGHADISYRDLQRSFGAQQGGNDADSLNDAPLREALNFLMVASLVMQDGAPRVQARFHATPSLEGVPFSLLLLHHIHCHVDQRQQALSLVHRQLILNGTLAISQLKLREEMERGPHRTLFAWTGEKVLFWSHLAAYAGLIRRLERSTEYLIVPQLDLVLVALHWAASAVVGRHPLLPLLGAIEKSLFTCFTNQALVHPGLAQALIALDRLGHIEVTHSADATQSVLLGDWRVSELRFLDLER